MQRNDPKKKKPPYLSLEESINSKIDSAILAISRYIEKKAKL